MGEVKKNAYADLILLNDNPLEDLNNLKSIEGVIIKGVWINKETIQTRLNEIAVTFKDQ